jgi:hypothetical protein
MPSGAWYGSQNPLAMQVSATKPGFYAAAAIPTRRCFHTTFVDVLEIPRGKIGEIVVGEALLFDLRQ